MKKILLVDYNADKMGGVERVICTLANNLLPYYNVQVCSIYKHSGIPYYSYDEAINIDYLIDNSECLSTKAKSQSGFLLARVPEKIVELLRYSSTIRKYVNDNIDRYDVVIFGRRTAALDFLPYMVEYKGKVIVREANHYYYTNAYERKKLKQLFPQLVDCFILSSDENLEAYKYLFGDSKINLKKLYNPLGIEINNNIIEREKSILGVGRFSRQKGFELLIEAFDIVHKEYPDWKLKLIGNGTYRQKYTRLCKKKNLLNSVEMYPSSNIVNEYKRAGIYVMTSRDEGYANSLVEAMACGTPSISVDWLMGVRDIINNNENGIIVNLKDRMKYFFKNSIEREDIDNLAKTIIELVNNEDYRQYLGNNAKEIIVGRDKKTIINEWMEIIDND